MKFKEGDYIIRTHRGHTKESEITIGRTYKVIGYSPYGPVILINDLGKRNGYVEEYFTIDKNRIVFNILNDL